MIKLEYYRTQAKLSQFELAQKLNLTQQRISSYERGIREPDLTTLKLIADFFHITVDDLLDKNDVNCVPLQEKIIKIPILGKISAGLPLYAEENLIGYDYLPASTILGDEYFCLVVQGDSMNMKFKEGDRVLIHKQEELENGEIGVFIINDDDATIKKYRYENGIVVLEPMSTNPEHHVQVYNPKDVKIRIVGKAIRYISDL